MARRYTRLTKPEYNLLYARVSGLLDADKSMSPIGIYRIISPSYSGPSRLTKGHIVAMWRKYQARTKGDTVVRWPKFENMTVSQAATSTTYSDSSIMYDHAISLIEAGLRLLKQGGVNGKR